MIDVVREALLSIDFPEEDVVTWLGAACGCPERARKKQDLQRWAVRTLQGKLQSPEDYLVHLLKTGAE